MDTGADSAAGLDPERVALLDAGSRVMWSVERDTLRKVLARHLRDGTSKYAKSVRTEGIECVALSLSAGLWIVRAFWIFLVGIALFTLGRNTPIVHTTGSLLLLLFAAVLVVGVSRLVQAWRHRRAFRQQRE